MRRLLVLCVLAGCVHPHRVELTTRHYWPTIVDSLATGHGHHTHVAVSGTVTLLATEDDGDVHLRVASPSGAFIVAECIPALPCPRPKLGQAITVYGISRRDPEHGWYEVHPVERWTSP